VVAGVIGALGAAAAAILPAQVERRLNGVAPRPILVGARARALHARLLVADLHADTLLWDRDLLRRGSRGHVDVPRLAEGGVALQAFTVVTKSPRNLNIERNDDRSDDITLLAVAQRWPPATWGSLRARSLHQATRLTAAARRSQGRLAFVRSAAELDAFLERRRADPTLVAGILGLEGSHALAGDLRNVDVLKDAGFRMMAPTHFFDTDIAGSAHGVAKGGLTDKGREWVRVLEDRGVLIDLAHASPRAIDDVLALARRPVVVSHTGVRGTCDNRRNLDDAQLRRVAGTGGVVGIGFWDTAVCGGDARAIARAIVHAARVAGPEHVGLGSDFDGAVTTPFDATGFPQITQALLDAGMPEGDIERIMGGNVVRLLRRSLP
jgi:microsomal dipeptidase-like Zn-dependent dipeptidase